MEPSPPTDKDEILDSFLWASKFHYTTPRFFPRLLPRILRVWYRTRVGVADRLLGRRIDTAGSQIEADHFHPDRIWYAPSGWTFLRRVLKRRDVGPSDVFIDFGSGKGRVLYQAAQYPFGRVIGVEISRQLNEAARDNLERNRSRLTCRAIDLVTADVTGYEVPDDVTVAYFCNPFVGDTFRRVVDNLVASLDRNPRRLRVVYAIPVMKHALLATGRFKRVRVRRVVHEQMIQRVALYESV